MKGSYLLLIKLTEHKKISIGKLGEAEFTKGLYIYIGSALNGLEQRIQRHLRKHKTTHWHIDYLVKHAEIVDVFYKESKNREECNIAKTFNRKLKSVPDFGCSDCNCKSHLFYGSKNKIMETIVKLKMTKAKS